MRGQKNPFFVSRKDRREARNRIRRRESRHAQPETMDVPMIDWMAMPIAEACGRRWMEGRAEYGETEFQGDPALELYEELIDSLNYLIQMRVARMETRDWAERLLELTGEVQAVHAVQQERSMSAGGAS